MNETSQAFAYRCTPLAVANASGWETVMPFELRAHWSGEMTTNAISLEADVPHETLDAVACSHFGHGILTFKLGYMFRTPPGIAIWARGTPNQFKEGIFPLEGITETDWLPFAFTMNWKFTKTGSVIFEKDEAFCFITIHPHALIDQIRPVEKLLTDDPMLADQHCDWMESRMTFAAALRAGDQTAVSRGWEKKYFEGYGAPSTSHHVKKRTLRPFTPSKGATDATG